MGKRKQKPVKKTTNGRPAGGKPGGKATISLCMIVRDEEESLPRCLSSLEDHVDEIVIVDTGSRDKTVEIAKEFGAKVHMHPWENDFSKHRNQSISYAEGDWILIMDADEEFVGEDAERLRNTVRSTQADCLILRCQDMDRSGRIRGVFNQIRLFRNGLGMCYARNIHNQLQTVGKEEFTRLTFRHYGYDLSPEKMEEKHRRTTSLLLERIALDPDNPLDRFELAASYSMNKEFEKAIQQGTVALDLRKKKDLRDSYFVTAYYIVAQGYLALGDLDSAEKTSLEALRFFDLDLDACYILASVAFRRGDPMRCKALSARYLEIRRLFEAAPEKMLGICFTSYGRAHEVHYNLGHIAIAEMDYPTAQEMFQKGFHEEARPLERAVRICEFYIGKGRQDEALSWLSTAFGLGYRDSGPFEKMRKAWPDRLGLQRAACIMQGIAEAKPECPAPWRILGDLEVERLQFPQAVDYYRRSLSLDPQQRDVYMKLGSCWERMEDLDSALALYVEMEDRYPNDPEASLRAAGAYLFSGEIPKAAEHLNRVEGTNLEPLMRIEKALLDAQIRWSGSELEAFLQDLEGVMSGLGMSTDRTIDSLDDLGEILCSIARRLCRIRAWRLGEMSLRLGAMIAPGKIDSENLKDLISYPQALPFCGRP